MYRNLLLSALVLPLVACSHALSWPNGEPLPQTYYDYTLYTPEGQALSLSELSTIAADADVILVGEWHTHSAIHRFQTEFLQQLVKTQPKLAVSMEQFSRDNQTIVDQYLASEIGEQTLMTQGNAWPNYESDYRPLIEFAKAKQLDVVAANAPRNLVRCVGRKGIGYLDTLSREQRAWAASEINTQTSPYKDKFMQSMHHGTQTQNDNQFAAQATWDETMAESIVNYLIDHPDSQVMHIAGKFHVEEGLGIKASIKRRAPKLNVMVISPVGEITLTNPDYQLHVLPPPARYIQQENRIKAIHAMMHHSDEMSCD